VLKRLFSGEHGDPCPALVPLGAGYFYYADLSGLYDMQSAAGAGIAALKAHYPHVSRKLFLASVFQRLELVGRGIKNIRGKVFVYGIVGFPFHHFQVFLTQLAVEVDRYALAAHMEPHVVITEMPVYQAGNDMLSRVLLHEPVAAVHITPAGGPRPRLTGR